MDKKTTVNWGLKCPHEDLQSAVGAQRRRRWLPKGAGRIPREAGEGGRVRVVLIEKKGERNFSLKTCHVKAGLAVSEKQAWHYSTELHN